jgi:hypothetical protein
MLGRIFGLEKCGVKNKNLLLILRKLSLGRFIVDRWDIKRLSIKCELFLNI